MIRWENPGEGFTAWVPDDASPLMVDSGRFQAVTIWPDCRYPYSPTELFDWAEENNADLIVMGTYGRSGMDRILLGSVTDNMIRRADIPVLMKQVADAE